MREDGSISQRLKAAGATDDMVVQYQRYFASGNRQGQERLLCRCRRIQQDRLNADREKLACLDYIIAKVEETQTFFEGDKKEQL